MNPETPQPTQTPAPIAETPAPQPTPMPTTPPVASTGFGAGQPAGTPPEATPVVPPVVEPQTSQPVVGQPVAPITPAASGKKGLFITLAILNVLFFIPTAIAVFVLYSSHKSALAAGDTATAARKLKTMQLVGWIGFAVGFVLFVLYLLSRSVSMAP